MADRSHGKVAHDWECKLVLAYARWVLNCQHLEEVSDCIAQGILIIGLCVSLAILEGAHTVKAILGSSFLVGSQHDVKLIWTVAATIASEDHGKVRH